MRAVYVICYILTAILWKIIFRMKVRGRENIPEGPFLCCANHKSNTDPVFMGMALTVKRHVHFMAKAELMRIPVLGSIFRGIGTYSVDRGKGDLTAIKTTLKLLKEGKIIGMFPEGHRIRDGEEGSAKNGVAMIATRAGAPILPMYISAYRLFRRVDIYIGKPYHPEFHGKKPSPEDYDRISAELLFKINELPKL